MRILTLENTAFEMNEIPDEVDDLRFSILDNSNNIDPYSNIKSDIIIGFVSFL